jgi:hypothetical protein
MFDSDKTKYPRTWREMSFDYKATFIYFAARMATMMAGAAISAIGKVVAVAAVIAVNRARLDKEGHMMCSQYSICILALALIAAESHPAAAMTLTSTDIKDGGTIPAAHLYARCGGQNISPALSWEGQPAAAKSLVLTVIDVDVKPKLWSHWVVTGLPMTATGLPQGAKTLPAGARAVASNMGDAAYAGPCPPAGSGAHHYQFTIWAMPTADFAIDADAPANSVLAKLSKDSIAHASLTASVER